MLKLWFAIALVSVARPALADDPKCTITKINGQSTSIDVANVWAKGDRWAEYNCRSDGQKAAKKWADDNAVCKKKGDAIKWSTAMGKPGAEKKWDSTAMCDGPSSGAGGGDARPGPSPSAGAAWDSTGWQKLGSRTVAGKTIDTDTITVGSYKGRFGKLTMVVLDSDLELYDFTIEFATGREFKPVVRHTFKEGSRTRVIDLPGDDRVIKKVTMRYKNVAGGGTAKVEIWAK